MAKTKLKDGCPGCDRPWNQPDSEGQCSRCNRCLHCCGLEHVPYTCANRYKKRCQRPGYAKRSEASYDRYVHNPKILGHNRRIY